MNHLYKSLTIAFLAGSIFISGLSADLVRAQSSVPEPKVALTPEEQAWLKAHPVITLGAAHGNYPPAEIKNPDGTWTGFNIDFYEQVSQLLNIKIRLHHGVWAEVQKKAKSRELDGLPIVGKDPNRDVHFNATNTIYPSYFFVFAPSRHNLQIKSFSDLNGMRIGYKRGARPAKTRLEKLPSAVLKPFARKAFRKNWPV
jgi:ABC-type amino acid transport substrate-binding protein